VDDAVMFKPLATKFAVLPAVVAAFVIGGAQPALATDYCVPDNTCAGTNAGTLENALTMAASGSNADRIFLAPGTYTAPVATGYAYDALNAPVEIIGAGKADTTVTSPSGGSGSVLSLYGGPGTIVRDLKVKLPPNSALGIYGLKTNGTARGIRVQEDVNNLLFMVGIVLNDGVLENSEVALGSWHPSVGVVMDYPGGTIRDSQISGNTAVQSSFGGTIERTRLLGRQSGVSASRNTTTIRSSSIDTNMGANPTAIAATNNIGIDTKVIADGVNFEAHQNSGTTVSADTFFSPDNNVDVVVVNSIIRGNAQRLSARATGSGTAHIAASYSDYAPIANNVQGAHAGISETNISNVGDADLELDTYAPFPSSPLIDAGDPATPQDLDIDGNPLVTDGNHDGVYRRDIGAYELPGPVFSGETLPPDPATGDPLPLPGDQPIEAKQAADTLAPLVAGFRTSHKVFTVTRARTAISARVARGTRFSYSLSESAKVVVTIKRAHTRRAAGRLTRSAKAGRNSLVFSGRIGRKALKRGRYSAAITATDAAGNRSAPRRVSFRVV
jgi:hypothetical protein